MINTDTKQKKEKEILEIFGRICSIEDKKSPEYKKLFQKIYAPIWDWALICFKEEDVRKAGLEIFHCIKRTLKNYKETDDSSYIGFLYSCLNFEIKKNSEKAEVKEFRMCSRKNYRQAVRLISIARKVGKNPSNKDVQIWLAKQSGFSEDEINDLVIKYNNSQILEEQIQNSENENDNSIFETESVPNNYLNPEEEFFKVQDILGYITIVEQVFDQCQTRQKEYLSSFITLRLLKMLEKSILVEQIVKLLQCRTFLDADLLRIFLSQEPMPTQSDLADKHDKDEGYISNRIKEFFEKVQNQISSE